MANPSGIPKRGMRDYLLNLDGVNEQAIDADGDFFHVQSVNPVGATVGLRFDDGPLIQRTQGEGNRVYYSRVAVTASVAAAVTLQLGYGYATDSRANGTFTTTIAPTSAATDYVPINPTVSGQHALVPVNNARKRVTIFSDPGNGGDTVIYIRKAGGANTIGFIGPGQALKCEATFGLDYLCTNGGDKLYIFEEA